jgi:hypothetical protein
MICRGATPLAGPGLKFSAPLTPDAIEPDAGPICTTCAPMFLLPFPEESPAEKTAQYGVYELVFPACTPRLQKTFGR